VPTTRLVDGTEARGKVLASSMDPGSETPGPSGPGHDPCLGPLRRGETCGPAKPPRRA
jgi:hypothetical protein